MSFASKSNLRENDSKSEKSLFISIQGLKLRFKISSLNDLIWNFISTGSGPVVLTFYMNLFMIFSLINNWLF